ncbi:MAG: hypothetical protein M3Q91_16525 [Acidobacteriota bacterium]|nr:hypothetical protein [Acidobacteriota bacterium]
MPSSGSSIARSPLKGHESERNAYTPPRIPIDHFTVYHDLLILAKGGASVTPSDRRIEPRYFLSLIM